MIFRKNLFIILLAFASLQQVKSQRIADRDAVDVVRYQKVHTGDGNYNFGYQTSNRISVHETGYTRNPEAPNNEQVNVKEGCFSFFSPEGYFVSTVYIADENGYQPKTTMTDPRDTVKHQEHIANPCGHGVTPETRPIPPRYPTAGTGKIPFPPRDPTPGTAQIPIPPRYPTPGTDKIPILPRDPTLGTAQNPIPPRDPTPGTAQIPCYNDQGQPCQTTQRPNTPSQTQVTTTVTTKPGCLTGREPSCGIIPPNESCIQGWEPSCGSAVPPGCSCQRDNFQPFAFRLLDNTLIQISYTKSGYFNKPTVTVFKNGSKIPYYPQVTRLLVTDSFLTTDPNPPIIQSDNQSFQSGGPPERHYGWSAY
ncbi:unnamed protein product [Allacma fusca]|uniref:Uncharacterized protein n=1 Tax=Allacma fusca TaxID=39272 RepID=A0A8J2KXB1_9HEXA|nr:unnamed protein product [Allacma fusca]